VYDVARANVGRFEQDDLEGGGKCLGIQPDESVVLLYQAAAALLLAPVVEGFALSAVEAARAGEPGD